MPNLSRRELLSASAVAAGSLLTSSVTVADEITAPQPIRYGLNTSTVRGHKLSFPEQIKLAADAGYDAIEPWVRDIDAWTASGGKLSDARKMLDDAGLTVCSAIAFANWIVDDEQQRLAGLEQAKREMSIIREVGGEYIAAPPAGATKGEKLDLFVMAERYAALLEVGAEVGVTPQLEVWGFSTNLSRLGESVAVAIESGHPNACLLPDVYHIYKGGSDFAGLSLLAGSKVHCLHVNDYPADPPWESIGDKDRVYPGDGIAPVAKILGMLFDTGFTGVLSLELFNPTYWQRPADEVAKTGLAKMKQIVAQIDALS